MNGGRDWIDSAHALEKKAAACAYRGGLLISSFVDLSMGYTGAHEHTTQEYGLSLV